MVLNELSIHQVRLCGLPTAVRTHDHYEAVFLGNHFFFLVPAIHLVHSVPRDRTFKHFPPNLMMDPLILSSLKTERSLMITTI